MSRKPTSELLNARVKDTITLESKHSPTSSTPHLHHLHTQTPFHLHTPSSFIYRANTSSTQGTYLTDPSLSLVGGAVRRRNAARLVGRTRESASLVTLSGERATCCRAARMFSRVWPSQRTSTISARNCASVSLPSLLLRAAASKASARALGSGGSSPKRKTRARACLASTAPLLPLSNWPKNRAISANCSGDAPLTCWKVCCSSRAGRAMFASTPHSSSSACSMRAVVLQLWLKEMPRSLLRSSAVCALSTLALIWLLVSATPSTCLICCSSEPAGCSRLVRSASRSLAASSTSKACSRHSLLFSCWRASSSANSLLRACSAASSVSCSVRRSSIVVFVYLFSPASSYLLSLVDVTSTAAISSVARSRRWTSSEFSSISMAWNSGSKKPTLAFVLSLELRRMEARAGTQARLPRRNRSQAPTADATSSRSPSFSSSTLRAPSKNCFFSAARPSSAFPRSSSCASKAVTSAGFGSTQRVRRDSYFDCRISLVREAW
eukprot:m.207739 g.207739  ORF g.207739 m.207739 type:complete len:496 (+) comp17792_c0_seq6:61-1548(+)